jgi:hypothetical protein
MLASLRSDKYTGDLPGLLDQLGQHVGSYQSEQTGKVIYDYRDKIAPVLLKMLDSNKKYRDRPDGARRGPGYGSPAQDDRIPTS